MNKIMLLLVVCTGFAASVPMSANALDPQVVSQNPHGETNSLIAQYNRNQNYDRDQNYDRNQNRDRNQNYDRDQNYNRNQNYDRQFSVYYRNYNDSRSERLRQRQWTLEGYHNNRRDARRAANRLERRGYITYVQVSREVNRGGRRG